MTSEAKSEQSVKSGNKALLVFGKEQVKIPLGIDDLLMMGLFKDLDITKGKDLEIEIYKDQSLESKTSSIHYLDIRFIFKSQTRDDHYTTADDFIRITNIVNYLGLPNESGVGFRGLWELSDLLLTDYYVLGGSKIFIDTYPEVVKFIVPTVYNLDKSLKDGSIVEVYSEEKKEGPKVVRTRLTNIMPSGGYFVLKKEPKDSNGLKLTVIGKDISEIRKALSYSFLDPKQLEVYGGELTNLSSNYNTRNKVFVLQDRNDVIRARENPERRLYNFLEEFKVKSEQDSHKKADENKAKRKAEKASQYDGMHARLIFGKDKYKHSFYVGLSDLMELDLIAEMKEDIDETLAKGQEVSIELFKDEYLKGKDQSSIVHIEDINLIFKRGKADSYKTAEDLLRLTNVINYLGLPLESSKKYNIMKIRHDLDKTYMNLGGSKVFLNKYPQVTKLMKPNVYNINKSISTGQVIVVETKYNTYLTSDLPDKGYYIYKHKIVGKEEKKNVPVLTIASKDPTLIGDIMRGSFIDENVASDYVYDYYILKTIDVNRDIHNTYDISYKYRPVIYGSSVAEKLNKPDNDNTLIKIDGDISTLSPMRQEHLKRFISVLLESKESK